VKKQTNDFQKKRETFSKRKNAKFIYLSRHVTTQSTTTMLNYVCKLFKFFGE